MNLSTARSSKRAVEIGVRKVLGAEKDPWCSNFFGKRFILSLIAFFLSVVLSFFLMSLFENIAGKRFYFTTQQYMEIYGWFVVVTLLAGLLAGLYPAFYLSAFKPVRVLKGRFSNSLSATFLRKGLVVFQFVISVALVVASITIGNQMRYLRNKDLGFSREQQIVIPLRTSTSRQIYPAFKNSLTSIPASLLPVPLFTIRV
jgi:putative ABC transport system permease protein